MTKDEALKLALEALETSMYPQQKQLQAITAIKEALAQPEQTPYITMPPSTPMWTIPAQRKPLTDEEVNKLVDDEDWYNDPHGFVRAIEAAHGIKE